MDSEKMMPKLGTLGTQRLGRAGKVGRLSSKFGAEPISCQRRERRGHAHHHQRPQPGAFSGLLLLDRLAFYAQAPLTWQLQVWAAASGRDQQSPAGAARHKGGPQLGI